MIFGTVVTYIDCVDYGRRACCTGLFVSSVLTSGDNRLTDILFDIYQPKQSYKMIYIILYMIRVILVFKQTEQIKKTKKGVKKGENKRNKGNKNHYSD